MVQCINDACHIFAHLSRLIPWTGNKLRCAIGQIGGDDFADIAFFIVSIKFFKTIGEKTKRSADEDVVCATFLDLFCNVKHAFTGGNHIIDDDNIFSGYGIAQEFMGYDRVLSVYDGRIVPSLVEHTHIDAKYVREVYGTCHSSLVRADDHQMIVVNRQIRNRTEKGF